MEWSAVLDARSSGAAVDLEGSAIRHGKGWRRKARTQSLPPVQRPGIAPAAGERNFVDTAN